MSPWRAGYGSASRIRIQIRKENEYWVWRLVVNAHDHYGDIGASGERRTWGEAFSAAKEECMWWVR
jgi:hypothetical protein